MKKMVFFLLILIVGNSVIGAQNSVYNALNKFIEQDFFKQFKQLKEKAEGSAKQFKLEQRKYKPDDVDEVRDSYNASIDNFNKILLKVKADMMNKGRRNLMVSYPATYTAELTVDFNSAKDFYDNTYRKKIAQLTESDRAGAAILLLLPDLIKYASIAISFVKQISSEMKKFKESMIDNYMIAPYRIKTWDEL